MAEITAMAPKKILYFLKKSNILEIWCKNTKTPVVTIQINRMNSNVKLTEFCFQKDIFATNKYHSENELPL